MDKFTITIEETWLDYPDPTCNAIIAYLTGCEHHCPGCHSQGLQEVHEYTETPQEFSVRLKDYCKRACTNKIVLLGGDPLLPANIPFVTSLLDTLQNYDVCLFTGYSIEYVKTLHLKNVKYYKCGTFDQANQRKSEKTDEHYVLASPNQNFYDANYNLLSQDGILTF